MRIDRTMCVVNSVLAAAVIMSGAMGSANGRQSPVNISSKAVIRTVHAAPLTAKFEHKVTLSVANTYDAKGTLDAEWATLKASVPAGSSVTVSGIRYNLLQFHFHTPSEHTLNNATTPMEVHFVFLREGAVPCGRNPDALLVIGARIVAGPPHRELGKIFDLEQLPRNTAAGAIKVENFDLGKVLGTLKGSWRYSGSLTAPASFVPTCVEPEGDIATELSKDKMPENVSWVLLTHNITLSPKQIASFKRLFPEGNARKPKPLDGRKVIFDAM